MKRIKTAFIAIALAFVGAGTIYALTIENNNPTEQVKLKRKCGTCDGTGRMKIRKTCSPCQGHGCSACDNKGYIEVETKTCPSCDGTGWINVR